MWDHIIRVYVSQNIVKYLYTVYIVEINVSMFKHRQLTRGLVISIQVLVAPTSFLIPQITATRVLPRSHQKHTRGLVISIQDLVVPSIIIILIP